LAQPPYRSPQKFCPLTAEAKLGEQADDRAARLVAIEGLGLFFISLVVIEHSQIGAIGGKYVACSALVRNEQMSHADELGTPYQRPAEAAVAKDIGRRGLDWAVLVVTFALGCTLAWICLLLWGVVRVFQVVLS
jgi:hypothetical protein